MKIPESIARVIRRHVRDPEESLAVWFTPDAIRDATNDPYDDDDQEQARAAWVEAATEEELRDIGYDCLGADPLWSLFRGLIEDAIDDRLRERGNVGITHTTERGIR